MSQLDYLVAQSMAHEREHDLQTVLRRRHPERHTHRDPVVVGLHRRQHHWLHDALAHLHLVHAQPH